MTRIALVTDQESLPIDYDMAPLVASCESLGLPVEIVNWDNPGIDWSRFELLILRSPWTYTDRLEEFLDWCRKVSSVSRLVNPLNAVEWNLNKSYLVDLQHYGVPIVPTEFIQKNASDVLSQIYSFIATHGNFREMVIKPSIGAYSKNVQRFPVDAVDRAVEHVVLLHSLGCDALIQPYFDSIDVYGESDLIFFNGKFSHAIRKGALLMADGTVNAPTAEFRKQREPGPDEIQVATAALSAAIRHLQLEEPLLYARADLIRSHEGQPVVLEMEISEPSLSLPFCPGSEVRFAKAIAAAVERLQCFT